MTKKGGRPSKWTPELNERLIEFFDIEEVWEERTKTSSDKSETTERIAKPLPKFSRFERQSDLSVGILSRWALEEDCEEKRPGFLQAYNEAKQYQKDFLVECGLQGLYPPAFAIFTAKNITDMKDRTEQDITSGGKPIPIYGGFSVQRHNGNQQDFQPNKAD